MNQPLVSIIIPCFNAQDHIARAIDSALGQSYPNKEVIVVDDGSTDRSLEVIKSYEGVLQWRSGGNNGACAARNAGIELAKGQFVQFLDADDFLLKEKISCQVPHAQVIGPGSLSICLGRTDAGDRYLDWQYARAYAPERHPVDFALNGILQTSAPLHRRELLQKVGGFDVNLPCAQEFDLHLRLVCMGLKLSQVPDVLYVVCRQPYSVSSNGLEVSRQKSYIFEKSVDSLRSNGALTPSISRYFGIAYANVSVELELGGYSEEASKCLREARALCPDAELLAWTPRWRPFVKVFGGTRVARFRRTVKGVLGSPR